MASTFDLGLAEVATALANLQAKHPALVVELVLGDGVVNPVTAGFDVAVHLRRLSLPALAQRSVARLGCGVFASPDYLLRHGVPTHPNDLSRHRCLGYTHQDAVYDWQTGHWSFTCGGAETETRVNLIGRFNCGRALLRHTLSGIGVAVLPHVRCRREVEANLLVPLLREWVAPELDIFVTTAAAATADKRLRAFDDAIGRVCEGNAFDQS